MIELINNNINSLDINKNSSQNTNNTTIFYGKHEI
jgi:hypothetical protein